MVCFFVQNTQYKYLSAFFLYPTGWNLFAIWVFAVFCDSAAERWGGGGEVRVIFFFLLRFVFGAAALVWYGMALFARFCAGRPVNKYTYNFEGVLFGSPLSVPSSTSHSIIRPGRLCDFA